MNKQPISPLVVSFCLLVLIASVNRAVPAAQKNDEGTHQPVRVPAEVRGYQTADLFAKVGGYIKQMKVDIGDTVTKGQPLCILDIPEMKKQIVQKQSLVRQADAQVKQAVARIQEMKARLTGYQAAVREAETMTVQKEAFLKFRVAENDRISKLARKGAIQKELIDSAMYQMDAAKADVMAAQANVATSEANLVGARAAVDRAKADLVAAESNVDVAISNLEYTRELVKYATIRAPFDGEITKRMYDAGAFVQSADGNSAAKPILRIVRMDKVRVRFALSMSRIKGIDKGDRVVFGEIDALPEATFEGNISRYSPGMDENTRMMSLEVDLDNQHGKLRPGFFGYVNIFRDSESN